MIHRKLFFNRPLATLYVTIKREERFHDVHVVSEQGAKYSMNFHPLIPELSVSQNEKRLSFYTEAPLQWHL